VAKAEFVYSTPGKASRAPSITTKRRGRPPKQVSSETPLGTLDNKLRALDKRIRDSIDNVLGNEADTVLASMWREQNLESLFCENIPISEKSLVRTSLICDLFVGIDAVDVELILGLSRSTINEARAKQGVKPLKYFLSNLGFTGFKLFVSFLLVGIRDISLELETSCMLNIILGVFDQVFHMFLKQLLNVLENVNVLGCLLVIFLLMKTILSWPIRKESLRI